jgi:pimeloyl-ACP methyl ester carboxylesterase
LTASAGRAKHASAGTIRRERWRKMARIEINGIGIEYEIVGDGNEPVAITPGGRFSKNAAGIRPLAEKLAAAGKKVLIWDRPNCGASDICFAGETESVQNADTLAGLLRALDFGPTYLVGGSGGARDTLLTAIRHPDVASRVFVLWISGGAVGIIHVASFYYPDSAVAALASGMSAVAALPGWKEQTERNPGNRDRLLAWSVPAFIDKLQAWTAAFFPQPGAPMPGVSVADLAGLGMPVMILRSGESDIHHTRETSERLHDLIPGSHLAEPPWGDREWLEKLMGQTEGGPFGNWPALADQILQFAEA